MVKIATAIMISTRVNARCLDEVTRPTLQLSEFDGRNWEAHAAELAHLSQESADSSRRSSAGSAGG